MSITKWHIIFFQRKRVKEKKKTSKLKKRYTCIISTYYIYCHLLIFNILSTFTCSPQLYFIYTLLFINIYKYIQNISTSFWWFLLDSFYNIMEQLHWIFNFFKRKNTFCYLILKNCFIFYGLYPWIGKLW